MVLVVLVALLVQQLVVRQLAVLLVRLEQLEQVLARRRLLAPRRRHLSQKRKVVRVLVDGLLPKVAVPIRLLLHCR